MSDKEWSDPNKVGGKYMAGVLADFAPALKEIAKLGSMNIKPNGKYERGSWKLVENPEVMYNDAFWRHLLEGPNNTDPDTGMPHDVAIAWNAIALVCSRLIREDKAGLVAIEAHQANVEEDHKGEPDDFDDVCPFCKYPLVLGRCSNADCEER